MRFCLEPLIDRHVLVHFLLVGLQIQRLAPNTKPCEERPSDSDYTILTSFHHHSLMALSEMLGIPIKRM